MATGSTTTAMCGASHNATALTYTNTTKPNASRRVRTQDSGTALLASKSAIRTARKRTTSITLTDSTRAFPAAPEIRNITLLPGKRATRSARIRMNTTIPTPSFAFLAVFTPTNFTCLANTNASLSVLPAISITQMEAPRATTSVRTDSTTDTTHMFASPRVVIPATSSTFQGATRAIRAAQTRRTISST